MRRLRKGRVFGVLAGLFIVIFLLIRLIGGEPASESEESDVDIELDDKQLASVDPIFEPQKYTVLLDPGHGGKDVGAQGANNTLEKDVTLITAQLIKEKLEPYDIIVELTRIGDTFISLDDRIRKANDIRADLFISIHYDGFESADVHGMTTYFYNEEDAELALMFHDALIGRDIEIRDRGVEFGNYYVLRESIIPAILLELGYITNPDNERLMNSDDFQDKISGAIADVVMEHYEATK